MRSASNLSCEIEKYVMENTLFKDEGKVGDAVILKHGGLYL